MAHTHTPKTSTTVLGIKIDTCACGARRRSDNKPVSGGTLDTQGWYISTDGDDDDTYEMIQTEGYGYDWSKQDVNDALDSHDTRNQD